VLQHTALHGDVEAIAAGPDHRIEEAVRIDRRGSGAAGSTRRGRLFR
jgi:hypothetical protein